MSSIFFFLVFISAAISLLPHSTTHAFTIQVAPHESMCFYEDLVVGQLIHISYQVSVGGDLDVDFWVSDPKQVILHIANKRSLGTYTFKTDSEGKFTYCFSNQLSSQYNKVLMFTIHGADVKPVDLSVMVDPIVSIVKELSNEMHAVKDEQQFIVTREVLHRNAAEQMNGRVLYWGLFQTLLLLVVCVFQVYYLKHFFEVKRVL